ncbi:alpha/beta hydrolase [Cellulomonas sp. JH27-2]|uniref:alpha/beta fold hydrolase n=1 Tax=Cellulomonas sp. JH27-2 TaxID=2774139 RepID=UPI0017834C40|nr:alpha/beta hydrolase [Cellulomonas sp. JH27-2]
MQPLTIHRYGNPDAPTVVLVHGLTDAGTNWPDLVAHWADAWDVVAPDLRGHGESPRFEPDQLDDAPDVLLADLLALLDEVAAPDRPVVLVGHSLGGILGLRAALARPDLVRALVLEDPAKPDGTRLDPVFIEQNLAFVEAVTADPAGEIEKALRETPWTRTEIEAWAAVKPLVDRAYLRRGLYLGDPAWEELFNALTVPTLLVLPEVAPMAPRADELHNDLVQTVVVAGAGHCVRRDRPEDYLRAVDAFLAEVVGHSRH